MIPVSIFLAIFLFFLLVIVLFTFFNVYHMVRFGKAGVATIFITTIYLVVFGIMLIWALSLIATADWSAGININPFSQTPITNSFFP